MDEYCAAGPPDGEESVEAWRARHVRLLRYTNYVVYYPNVLLLFLALTAQVGVVGFGFWLHLSQWRDAGELARQVCLTAASSENEVLERGNRLLTAYAVYEQVSLDMVARWLG